VQTAYNSSNNGAPFVDRAQLKLWKRMVVVALRFLVRFGLRTPPPMNESFDRGSVRFVLSTKNRCVVAANVMHKRRKDNDTAN